VLLFCATFLVNEDVYKNVPLRIYYTLAALSAVWTAARLPSWTPDVVWTRSMEWECPYGMGWECPSGDMRLVVVALIDCIQSSSSSNVASAVCRSSSLVRWSISQLPDGAGESRSRETRSLPVGRLMSVLFRSRRVVGTTRWLSGARRRWQLRRGYTCCGWSAPLVEAGVINADAQRRIGWLWDAATALCRPLFLRCNTV